MDFHHVPHEESVCWIQNHLSGSCEQQLKLCGNNKDKLEYFCDIVVVMGLMCIMPMLEVVHALMKFAHARDMCDFVTIVK